MKIIDLLNDDEQEACRQKGTDKVKVFLKSIPRKTSAEDRFDRLHAFFLQVQGRAHRFDENFEEEKIKERGNDLEDLKILARGTMESVQMMDDICDAMVSISLTPAKGMTRLFKVCSTQLGVYTQKLQESRDIIPFPMSQARSLEKTYGPAYDMVVGK